MVVRITAQLLMGLRPKSMGNNVDVPQFRVRITAQLLMGFSIEEEIFPPRVFIEYKLVEILECLTYKPNGVLM